MNAAWFWGLLVLGLVLLWLARQGRARSGLPRGRVVYSDTGGWDRLRQPLLSRELLISGKPDYLVADGADIIPVEVKSGHTPSQPYASHVLQLATYCLLVEECYGRRPPYGIIRYPDQTFEMDYTPELEDELWATLDDMRADLAQGDVPRSHEEPHRCLACGHREHCDQALR